MNDTETTPPKNATPHKSLWPSIILTLSLTLSCLAIGTAWWNLSHSLPLNNTLEHITKQVNSNAGLMQANHNDLEQQLDQQQQHLGTLTQQMNTLYGQTVSSWLSRRLNQIAYLVEVANIQLHVEQNLDAALRLLNQAQKLSLPSEDFRMIQIRNQLNNDIIRLDKQPNINPIKLINRLDMLQRQVQQLSLPLPQYKPTPQDMDTATTKTRTWREMLTSFGNSIKSLVTIRKHRSLAQQLPTAAEARWKKQNIMFTLNEAQWAILHHDTPLYQHNLDTAIQQLHALPFASLAPRDQIITALTQLKSKPIALQIKDISQSLRAIENAFNTNVPSPRSKPLKIPQIKKRSAAPKTPPHSSRHSPKHQATPSMKPANPSLEI